MYPTFRGRKLNMKNNYDYFQQITLLVGNKNERFKLLIDSIELLNS